MAGKCQDTLWLGKLSYMASTFHHLNKLNTSLQGEGGEMVIAMRKLLDSN